MKFDSVKVYIKKIVSNKELDEYYDLQVNFIYSYDNLGQTVCNDDSESHKFNIYNLLTIGYSNQNGKFVVQVGSKRTESKIYVLNNRGETLYEVEAPLHYTFHNTENHEKEVEIVCQVDDTIMDKYRKNNWIFWIELHPGKLTEQSLSY